jgi:hypothetical protein
MDKNLKPKREDFGWFVYQHCGYEYGFFSSDEGEVLYKKAMKEYKELNKK